MSQYDLQYLTTEYKPDNCETCKIKKMYASKFNSHFDWVDCPYKCEYGAEQSKLYQESGFSTIDAWNEYKKKYTKITKPHDNAEIMTLHDFIKKFDKRQLTADKGSGFIVDTNGYEIEPIEFDWNWLVSRFKINTQYKVSWYKI